MNTKIMIFISVCLISYGHVSIAHGQMPELKIALGHTFPFTAVAFSPDGKFILSGSGDRTLKLWDVASGKEIRAFQWHSDWVKYVAFSPDGKRAASAGGYDKMVKLWDIETGREIKTFIGHMASVQTVVFSPNGEYLLSGSADNTLRLWDINKGKTVRIYNGASTACFSPDGKYVLGGSDDNVLHLWDFVSGIKVKVFKGKKSIDDFNVISEVAFSPDGKYVLSGGWNNVLTLWDFSSGEEIRRFEGHSSYITSIKFSPDGKYVLSGSNDNTIKLWDRATGKEVKTFKGHSEAVWSVDFSPDGKSIISGSGALLMDDSDNTLRIWDIKSGKELKKLQGYVSSVNSVAVSPDNKYILSGTNDKLIKLWDITQGKIIKTFSGHELSVDDVCFSPDGNYILSSDYGTIKLWDTNTGKEIYTFEVGNPIAFSPDGRFILAGTGYTDSLQLWDIDNFKKINTFSGHDDVITSIEFSPDGKYAISASWDSTAKIWDVHSGKIINTLKGHNGRVYDVSFNPKDQFVLTCSGDNTVKLWDIKTGKEVKTFYGHSMWVTSVCFSPDGQNAISGSADKTIKLWNIASGIEEKEFKGHTSYVNSVRFDYTGKYIISGSADGTIKLWNVKAGNEVATLVAMRGDNTDYVIVNSDRLFDGTTSGIKNLLHFASGNEIIELEQLKDRYYEPGLLSKIMGYNDEPLLNVKALSEAKLYPTIELNQPSPNNPELQILLKNRGGGIGKVVVYINDKEITADARDPGTDPNTDEMELTLNIADHPYLVPGEENIIAVKAFNGDGYLSSRNIQVIYNVPAETEVEPPTLYGIVSGVSEYRGDEIDLRFAAKDAVDMAQALNIGALRLFGADRTFITLLTTEQAKGAIYPNKDNLLKAFSDVAGKAKSTDILVVYLAGHGVTYGGQDGDYYYLTAEAGSGNLKDDAIRQQRAISSRELTELIKKIPALKQVLILDTCHSGRFSEDITKGRAMSSSQIRAYERMKDRTGLHILAGSAADAIAYESSSYGQGILTYSLLLGMRGAALRDGEYIDISQLFQYSADQVPALAKNIGGIQRPVVAVPYGGTSFDIGQLGDEDKPNIPLAQVRPLVLRAFFSNDAPPFDDNLGLNKLLNEALRDISARGREASLVFVDADEFPQAYKLSGRYKITDGKVAVTVYLLVGKEPKGDFQVKGDVQNIEQLVADIVKESEKSISK